ncbi:hypothetical protein CTAYLR_008029 [Chrysophaeum taylorii]|uniref:PHD-type domain-containing protein n=1 Tax=Chrysophaeum taylorii TaxID=2483200 RepID=A0AAD7XKF5_9STRA|nr:hypothetical protein CTAYLR_008029 [Chrysophaeum taylorii]
MNPGWGLVWVSDSEARERGMRFGGESVARPRAVGIPESQDACACCGLANSSPDDDIVYCDGCDEAFHQSCYHIPVIPEKEFYCRRCLEERQEAEPTDLVAPPLKVDSEEEDLSESLRRTGLDSCVDLFIVAATADRFGTPVVGLKELVAACASPLRSESAYVAILRRGVKAGKWCVSLARSLEEAGFGKEAYWVLGGETACDDDVEARSFERLGNLDPRRRARVLRCALDASTTVQHRVRDVLATTETGLRLESFGVDSAGRSYFLFQDATGSFAVCRCALGQTPPLSAKSKKIFADSRKAKKRPKKKPLPKHPRWETMAATGSELGELARSLRRSSHGDDLWISCVLRDKLVPHLNSTLLAARLEAKRQERALRRTKAAQKDLLIGNHAATALDDRRGDQR